MVERQASGAVTREAESRAVAALLTDAAAAPAGLVVEGEAGIGKTTLWVNAIDLAAARGFRVLCARGHPGEVSLTFTALADLLADVDPAVIAGLAAVQQTALNRVLLHTNDGSASDERAIAAAFQSVVQRLAADAPVLIAIDDVQWLDSASSAAVRFAVRRLAGPVAVLVTARSGEPESVDVLSWLQLGRPEAVRQVRMAPLTLGGVHALVAGRLGRVLPRPTMLRIHEVSGGNPLYALELARAVDDGRGIDDRLPDTLAALVRARVKALDDETAALLLAVACAADPTVEVIALATGDSESRVVELLESGDAARIVSIEGNTIRFSHPLLAAGVYTGAEPGLRRDMHRRLADVVNAPELKARHLASAATSADPATLEALDAAAAVTSSQGAPTAAAELLELAITLGGDSPVRRILAARHHFEAGSIIAARSHLTGVVDGLPPGVIRGAAVMLQGAIDGYDGSFTAAADALAEGVAQTRDNPQLQLQGLMLLAPAVGIVGQLDASMEYARAARDLADQLGDAGLRSQTRALWVNLCFQYGLDFDADLLAEALDLQTDADTTHVHVRADAIAAVVDAWTGQLGRARDKMRALRQLCVESGNELDEIWVETHSAMISVWSGDYPDAAQIAEGAMLRAEQMGGHHARLHALNCRAAVAAYTGDVDDARTVATTAIDLARATGGHFLARYPTASLGFLEVSVGNYPVAVEVLESLLRDATPDRDTEIPRGSYLADAIEALTALGRVDDAEPLVKALEDNGNRLDRPWMHAIGARGRALCLAARGELKAAEAAAVLAVRHHERLPMPFEKARTQLVLGQLQRRRRHRQDAAASLSVALSTFDRIGTPRWAQRARAELARLSGAPVAGVGLTAAEQRVAQRAAAGLSNREIAAELFLSTKTVEMNLSRVYRKLGIRSRSQLHSRLSDADARENPASQ